MSVFQRGGPAPEGRARTRSSTLAVGEAQSASQEFTIRLPRVEGVGRCRRGSWLGLDSKEQAPRVGVWVGSPQGQRTGLGAVPEAKG